MSYVVLARKWRPQSFEDLVGQEHVSTTLANAIARNRVAHAFLFTGVRGVGKTTSARILAKTLNCLTGPTATPCQTCAPCKEITAGCDVDVQEIDGASYNGVDEIRRLQESLPYRPARDRFKIFIVDEVHMLSSSAWNAFLKTLEEPPPHVKFIFATTEVHKVPVTILSRCQRYDFKLLSAQTIAARLRHVLRHEGVAAEEGAVATLSREAAGSMRDAMSLLDQVIAWVGVDGDKLTAEGVARVLGVADRTVLHRLCDALVAGDAAGCLRIVGELAQEGYDLPHVARDILAHLRDLVVAKVCTDNPTDLLDLSAEEAADVKALATRTDTDDLTRLHQGFSRSLDDIIRSGQPRAALEMSLVRLARRPPLMPIDELLRRLGDLERRLTAAGGGGAGSTGAPGGSGSRAAPVQQSPARRSFSSAEEASAPRTATPPACAAVPEQALPPARAVVPQALPLVQAPPLAQAAVPPQAPTPAQAPPPAAAVSTPLPSAKNGAASARSEPFDQPAPPGGASAPHAPDLGAWRAIVESVRARRAPLASILEHAAVLEMRPGRVVLAFESTFLAAQATESNAKEILHTALTAHFGHPTEAIFNTEGPRAGAPLTVAQVDSAERKARLDAARRAVTTHPLVTAAIELLGAELQAVRLPQDSAESEPQPLYR